VTKPPPHLDTKHPQYPDGFPERVDDDLLGHWKTPDGMVVVENHPHGYEIHLGPCYDFENCDACSPDRGSSNPHTPDDGHDFRACENHGTILTVAGGEVGEAAVLQYLADAGSPPHEKELAARRRAAEKALADQRKAEAEENARDEAELAALAPSPEERLAALEAEIADLRTKIG